MTVAAATPVTFILSRITKMRFSTTFIPPETSRMKRGVLLFPSDLKIAAPKS